MRIALPPRLWESIEALLSSHTRRLLLWLLTESVQEVINSNRNWKIVINSSGKSIKTSIELFEQLAE